MILDPSVSMTWVDEMTAWERDRLQNFSVADYVKFAVKKMASAKSLELLEQAVKEFSVLEGDLWLLWLVYRQIPEYLEEKLHRLIEEKKNTPGILVDLLVAHLQHEAEFFRTRAQVIQAQIMEVDNAKKKEKYENEFRQIYKESNLHRKKVSQLLRDMMVRINTEETNKKITYDALKKRYYRWCACSCKSILRENKNWPTDECYIFIALFSIYYDAERKDGEKIGFYVLKEGIGAETSYLLFKLNRLWKPFPAINLYAQRYRKIMKIEDKAKKQWQLQQLARKHYIPAMQALIQIDELPSNELYRYRLQMAIEGETESAKKLEWQASSFSGISLEVCKNGTGLRSRKEIAQMLGGRIPSNSVLKFFRFNINRYSDDWCEIERKLKGIRYSENMDCFGFPLKSDKRNHGMNIQQVTIPATPNNYSVLMKNAKKFPINATIRLHFSSRKKNIYSLCNFELIDAPDLLAESRKEEENFRKEEEYKKKQSRSHC